MDSAANSGGHRSRERSRTRDPGELDIDQPLSYTLGNVSIGIRCGGSYTRHRVSRLIQLCFTLQEGNAESTHINFDFTLSSTAPVNDLAYRKVFTGSSGITFRIGSGGILVELGESWMALELAENVGTGRISEDFWTRSHQSQREFFHVGLVMMLRQQGLFGVHANVLRKDERGLMVVGSPGCGKTTLSLGLIQEGWSFLSDDYVLLRSSPQGVEALPFRRGFSVADDTLELFPHLKEAKLLDVQLKEGKNLAKIEDLYPDLRVSAVLPNMVVFPQRAEDFTSTLRPVEKIRALFQVVQHSAGIMAYAPSSGDQLELMKDLVEQTACFYMFSGADVYRDPSNISRLLLNAVDAK